MEQRPILLFFRKLIALVPVNMEMVLVRVWFGFGLFKKNSSFFPFSPVCDGGEMPIPSNSSDELWGFRCSSCCREKRWAVSWVPWHPTAMWLAVLGNKASLLGACTLEKVLASCDQLRKEDLEI